MKRLISFARLGIGLAVMAVGVAVWTVLVLLLLPSRTARIKACNYFGKTICRSMVIISGCPVSVTGWEHLDRNRPAIYISNHTSIMDIFLATWLSPVGTCGIAKKEVVWYPFFGQLYLLSGHLRLDRGNTERAVQSLKDLAVLVRKKGLSIFLWPEGTRSRSGRLLPFKKGLVHLALQTGLPIVPIVVEGAYRAWVKRTLTIEVVPIRITVLPAIDTSPWSAETIDEHLEDVASRFRAVLPEEQQPSPKAEAA